MPGDVNGRDPGSGVRDQAFGARDERVLVEVDRELRAALSLSPSANFEARVLARVAEEDAPSSRSHYGWLAAAAAIVLVAGLFYALNRTSTTPVQVAPPQMAERGSDVVLPPPPAQPLPARATRAHVREPAAPASRPHARRAEPEAIVPLNQIEAVRRLVRAVNEGRIEVPPEPPTELLAPAAIVVQPLIVNPIPVPALETGVATPQQPSRGA